MGSIKNLIFFLSTLTILPTIQAESQPKDKVLASTIKTITLDSGHLTTSRRTSPIPQLKCIGGNACHHPLKTLTCHAYPSSAPEDSNDIPWTCTAETGPYFKVGSTQVLCEGYDFPEDPYILKGSCGVEYRLLFTEKGERKYRDEFEREQGKKKGGDVVGVLFWILFAAVFCFILYGITKQAMDGRRRTARYDDNGGYHDGDDGDDPPPPPFTADGDEDLPPPYSRDPPAPGNRGLRYGLGAVGGVAGGIVAQQLYQRSRQEGGHGGEGSSRTQEQRQETRTGGIENRRTNGRREMVANADFGTRSGWTMVNSSSTSDDSNFSTGFGGTTRR